MKVILHVVYFEQALDYVGTAMPLFYTPCSVLMVFIGQEATGFNWVIWGLTCPSMPFSEVRTC